MSRTFLLVAALGLFSSVQALGQSVPPIPTGLEIDCVTSNSVEIAWKTAASTTGIYVERAEGIGPFQRVGDSTNCVCGTQNEFDWWDLTAQPGRQYFYRVQAYNRGHKGAYATSAYSNIAVANTPAAVTAIQQPSVNDSIRCAGTGYNALADYCYDGGLGADPLRHIDSACCEEIRAQVKAANGHRR